MKYLALIALLFASPALGQGQIAGWEVSVNSDNCAASKTVLGTTKPSTLGLLASFDGAFGMVMINHGWSVQQGQRYDLLFLIDEMAITGTAIAGIGSLNGIITSDILSSIAGANRLTAFLDLGPDSEQMLEQFDLDGSGAAITELRQCAIEQAGFRDAERRRAELIPADPFRP